MKQSLDLCITKPNFIGIRLTSANTIYHLHTLMMNIRPQNSLNGFGVQKNIYDIVSLKASSSVLNDHVNESRGTLHGIARVEMVLLIFWWYTATSTAYKLCTESA